MGRKKIVWLLVIINALILAVLVGLKMKLDSARKQQLAYPVILENYSTIGTFPDWVIRKIQPQLVGFASENGRNYLKVEYPDVGGSLISEKVFVTGKVDDDTSVKMIYLENETGQVESLDFAGLKKRLKQGQQIGIEYFASVPSPKTELGEICNRLENFCALAKLKNSGNEDGGRIFAFRIYLALQYLRQI